MRKKFLSILCIVMAILTCVPIAAMADGNDTPQQDSGGTQTASENDLTAYVKSYVVSGGEGDFTQKDFEAFIDTYIKRLGLKPVTDPLQQTQRSTAGYYHISRGNKDYYLKPSQAENIARDYATSIVSSDIDDTAKAKLEVQDMMDNINVKPDMDTATTALSGFGGVISVAVGIIIVLITLLIVLVTTCDICYITLPTFREKQDTSGRDGGGWNAVVNRLISQEARYCVKECSMDSGKNPLAMYLGKRVFAYILLALALFILLTGNISVIINIVLTGASGIADALKALGGGLG